MDNLRHVLPDASVRARRILGRQAVRNTLKNYYDIVRLPHMKAKDIERTVVMRGKEHLEQAAAQGRGVILVGGHIGNFSVVAQIVAIRGYKVAIVTEDIQPPKLYDLMTELRGSHGIKLIKSGGSQVRTIYRFLRENGLLLLAADRDISNTGEPVLFFGEEADLPPGPVVLAQRLNVPLVPAHTVRLPDNTSIVNVYPPLELQRTGDNDRDAKANMALVARVLEEMIRKAPDQWVVLQRIWDRAENPRPALAEAQLVETNESEERSPTSVAT